MPQPASPTGHPWSRHPNKRMRAAGNSWTSYLFVTLCIGLAVRISAQTSCSDGCHLLSTCEADVCRCLSGTIDASLAGQSGQDCREQGWAVRYVTEADPAANLNNIHSHSFGMPKCHADARGFFLRLDSGMQEVHCLYEIANKPSDVSVYGSRSPDLNMSYSVMPSVYAWTLTSSSNVIPIPPTGMTVDQIFFDASCAQSGCWVIRGVLTTGESFGSFGSFNTFFLPQTQLHWTDQCHMVFERSGVQTCWTLSEESASWDDASAACGGTLARIASEEDNLRFFRMLARRQFTDTAWIGLNDKSSEGNFTWDDGSDLAFSAWANGALDENDATTNCVAAGKSLLNAWQKPEACAAAARRYVCESTAPADVFQPSTGLSYDFDYSSIGVEWTFSPANHPCTSAEYDAGVDGSERISTCCITDPSVEEGGGFVANYRPMQAFVDWSSDVACDYFVDRGEDAVCVKLYEDKVVFDQAQARCEVAGGRLATVQSADETAALLAQGYSTSGVWIGLSDSGSEGSFLWKSGWDGSYTNWWVADPQGEADANDNDCAYAQLSSGEWLTAACAAEKQYLCEFDAPEADHSCVGQVIQRPGHTKPDPVPCWKVMAAQASFEDAEAACGGLGGSLASLADAEESWYLHRLAAFSGVGDVWIGLQREGGEYATWASGAGVEYENFAAGHGPDASAGEDCVLLDSSGTWRNVDCAEEKASVCQIPRAVSGEELCDSDRLPNVDGEFNVHFPGKRASFVYEGKFKGMPESPGVVELAKVDAFLGKYEFEIRLDEVELRTVGGLLKGSVDVEHTVDTFLGLANFRPTGTAALDTFATQINIHLERTAFFTVSTFGVNDYTFLEYVNLRLVEVYIQDTDFSGTGDSTGAGWGGSNDDEAQDRYVSTDAANAVAFLQVTLTLGSQFQPNMQSGGLIPLDSVRAGKGDFIRNVDVATPSSSGDMTHVCQDYSTATEVGVFGFRMSKETFEAQVGQECGPVAAMCSSPSQVTDDFVSFNVPLGLEVLEDSSSALETNVFVHMVINAIDTSASGNPNGGDDPQQMKTELEASIGLVRGGVDVFCDGVTAKTDLKDVASADLVVGTSANPADLRPLRLLSNVANTQLSPDDLGDNVMDSKSIEGGLLTLVLYGQESYFARDGSSSSRFSLELDDVITIHIIENGRAPGESSTVVGWVRTLLFTPPDDNSDAQGLDTDGYKLNGAFFFSIDRDAPVGTARAKLQPTPELLQHCPFHPPRVPGSVPMETCVVRRDVHSRQYPTESVGSDETTAMELAAWDRMGVESPVTATRGDVTSYLSSMDGDSLESDWMASPMGDRTYARDLAIGFAAAIDARYRLNGRYRRAYWINPGYDWTPVQTGGRSRFSLSQKLFLFALISLEENGQARRRMLLQSDAAGDEDELATGNMLNAMQLSFDVTQNSLMAAAYGVALDKVAKFVVTMKLTRSEACMDQHALQQALRHTLEDYLEGISSARLTVQVTALAVDMGEEVCGRRSRRAGLLDGQMLSSAVATVDMVVVFAEDEASALHLGAFEGLPGVLDITPAQDNAVDYRQQIVVLDELDPLDAEDDAGAGGAPVQPAALSPAEPAEGSDNSMVLKAGLCGGAGGVLLLGLGGYLVRRGQTRSDDSSSDGSVEIAQHGTIGSIADVKARFGADLCRMNLHDEIAGSSKRGSTEYVV